MLLSTLALAAIYGIVLALVARFVGVQYVPVAAALLGATVIIQYLVGRRMALTHVNASPMPDPEYPTVHALADDLATEMGITRPELRVATDMGPNAFAVGRKGAGVIVLSQTLLDILSRDELEAVLAHEFSHLKSRDVPIMVVGQTFAMLLSSIVYWVTSAFDRTVIGAALAGILTALSNAVVMLIVRWISRTREYVADSDAAHYTGNPEALARALAKIRAVYWRAGIDPDAHIGAFCIFNGSGGLRARLFGTHPPMDKRINRLAPDVDFDVVLPRTDRS